MAKLLTNPAGLTCSQAMGLQLRAVIIPVLNAMGLPYSSPQAAALLLTTAWTEGLCFHRDQLERATGKPGKPGPAYSVYQIELPTFRKMATKGGPEQWPDLMPQLRRFGLDWIAEDNPAWLLTCSEVGATIAARGLYWSDFWSRRKPLPQLDPDEGAKAAAYYIGTWRPAEASRPDARKRFMAAWPEAVALVRHLLGGPA